MENNRKLKKIRVISYFEMRKIIIFSKLYRSANQKKRNIEKRVKLKENEKFTTGVKTGKEEEEEEEEEEA